MHNFSTLKVSCYPLETMLVQFNAYPGWLYMENFWDNRQKREGRGGVGKPLNAATKQIMFKVRLCNSNALKVNANYTKPWKKGVSSHKWIMLSKRNYCTRPQKGLIGFQRITCHLEETIALGWKTNPTSQKYSMAFDLPKPENSRSRCPVAHHQKHQRSRPTP